MNMIPQSHFLAMTLKISISLLPPSPLPFV